MALGCFPSNWRLLIVVLGLGIVTAETSLASFGHRRDPDRIRILSAVDTPDPFLPPGQTSTLSVSTAVRKLAGLGAVDEGDDDDCDDDRDHRRTHSKTFEVTVRWTIKSGSRVTRVIEKTVEIRPPLNISRLPTGGLRRTQKKFALIPLALEWDGRSTNGQLTAAGKYSWEAEALFTRTHVHRGRVRVKIIDESDPVKGTVTISGGGTPPPTITITQPAPGSFIRTATTAVTGAVTGQAPLTVKINGVAAAVGASTYAGSATLVEGTNTITAVVSDGSRRSSQAMVSVTKDGSSPLIAITSPTSGSSTANSAPEFVVEYSDAAQGSGIDTSTLSWRLDGATLAASHTAGAALARITPAAPIAPGSHQFTASIQDRAGNSDSASTTFSIIDGKPAPPSVNATPGTTNIPVITLSGGKPANTALLVNGVIHIPLNASTTWSTTKTLFEGSNLISLQARSSSGLISDPTSVSVTLDTVPPTAPTVTPPPADVTTPVVTISGTKPAGSAIVINGAIVVPASGTTSWSFQYTLQPGRNEFGKRSRGVYHGPKT